jgi:hypothetical protein
LQCDMAIWYTYFLVNWCIFPRFGMLYQTNLATLQFSLNLKLTFNTFPGSANQRHLCRNLKANLCCRNRTDSRKEK